MKEKLLELAELFNLMPEWVDRYNYLIELGCQMPPVPVAFKVAENRITCHSQLYFYVYYSENTCYIEAEANSSIPQGLAALLYVICNGRSRDEISENLSNIEAFLHTINLPRNLTPVRRQALFEMLGKIKKSCSNIL